MIEIVTLAEAKLFVRVEHDEEDALLTTMIAAATETALAVADAWDVTATPPARLKLAVLAHVARAYDGREGVDAPEGNGRLLAPLRVLGV